jgi:carbon-monoxide dehydrogenase medium subunit
MSTIPGELHEVQRAPTPVARVVRADSWRAALEALQAYPGARPVSGGTDLLLDLARSTGDPVTLVDLSAVAGARDIVDDGSALVLGAGVTHNQVVADPRFRESCLPLAQACLEIGSPQLRNRATLAGNVATASPANDSISALMALGASVVLTRLDGESTTAREVDVAGFFTGFRATVLAPDELITAIRVPKMTADARGIWVKVGLRRAQAISVVHAAMVVEIIDGRVAEARLALGSVAPTVITSHVFPAALLDRPLDDATIAAAAAAVASSIEPIDDVRATADYRTAVTEAVLARALRAIAAGRAGEAWPDDPPVLGVRTPSTPPPTPLVDDGTEISMTVIGEPAGLASSASTTLLDWLRDHSSVATPGVKEGCAEGECGACTVRLDGAAVMGCLVAAAQADGADVSTVEGLARLADDSDDDDSVLHPLQASFIDQFAVQCGFCIPGFLMAGAALLDEHPSPSDEQLELGLSGNLCRCTGYYPIAAAVLTAGTPT